MRLHFFSLLLVTALALIPLASAAGTDQAPASARWVDASFDLAQPTLTHMDFTGQLMVHKYLTSGSTKTASQMSQAYAGGGSSYVADIESSMKNDLAATLASAFPGATITGTSAKVDLASLAAARVDDYTPPILVNVVATIDRTRADVGLGSLSDAAVAAAFSAGARITTQPTLVADPGYKTTYTIHAPAAPAGLAFTTGSAGTRAADDRSVSVTIDNLAGTAAKSQPTPLVLRDPTATVPAAEDITNTIDIKLGEPKANVTTLPVDIAIAGEMHAIDPAARLPGVLPASVKLSFLSADAMRALSQAGAITEAQLKSADDSLLAETKTGLAKAFGSGIAPTGGISRADLATLPAKPFADDPPVRFLATASATHPIPGDHAKDLDLALDIGATVKFDLALFASNHSSTFVIHAPPNEEFTDAKGGLLSSDHKTATFAVPAGSASPSAALSMRKIDAPKFTVENATLGVVIDLQDVRVTIGQAAGGNFGDLVVDVTATGALDVIGVDRLPDSVKSQVQGANIDLKFLSGDAVRKSFARGLISDAELASAEQKLLNDTANGLAGGMGGPVDVTGGFDKQSLSADAGAGTPVRFLAHAHFLKPLSGGGPPKRDTQAIALKTIQQTFSLKRVDGFDTTYTIIFPKGLDVASVTPNGATSTTGTSADGRSQFVVTPNSNDASASVAIAVTPTFVMIKFWPVVLVAAILVVLLIGTPIALVALRRNKKKKA